eukprot:352555-Chlamydomonas_euryale.AAC.2
MDWFHWDTCRTVSHAAAAALGAYIMCPHTPTPTRTSDDHLAAPSHARSTLAHAPSSHEHTHHSLPTPPCAVHTPTLMHAAHTTRSSTLSPPDGVIQRVVKVKLVAVDVLGEVDLCMHAHANKSLSVPV